MYGIHSFMHSIEAVYQKSQQLGVEIFIEILDDCVIHEQIGSTSKVSSHPMRKGSSAIHTHLNNHPPSVTDFLMGLRCTLLYGIEQSGVIGPDKMYYYRYKSSLLSGFSLQIPRITRQTSSILFGSDDPCNQDHVDDLGQPTRWINEFRKNLARINRLYVTSGNDFEYVRKLGDLGIDMSIERKCISK